MRKTIRKEKDMIMHVLIRGDISTNRGDKRQGIEADGETDFNNQNGV